MKALRLNPLHSLPTLHTETRFQTKPISFNANPTPNSIVFFPNRRNATQRFKLYTATSLSPDIEAETETETTDGEFDWYSEWYPIMPVCDLDKRVPHAKRVMGVDVAVWWDRNESEWRVFDDACPHRLAPLSEGRIDQKGRLQCVYHGWCFNGVGDCKLIPQAPLDGPQVHTFKKACAVAYPCTVQNDILWFWPNSDPEFKDILAQKKPPYYPELDDPSFTKSMGNRDIPYGYEILVENLMDPAHVPYAHYGIMQMSSPKEPVDREGGMPLNLSIKSFDPFGFVGEQHPGISKFYAPCVFSLSVPFRKNKGNEAASSATPIKSADEKRLVLIFICVPVSPGKSRMIWAFPRNFGVWIENIVPRWMFHINQNLIIDSDLYLLHVEERKIMEVGPEKWQQSCFVPTKSDAFVVGFRKWLNKYAGGKVDWRGKFTSDNLPPTPPREELMDRYWSHVVNCSSCKAAHKSLNILETVLQIMSVSLLGIAAASRHAVSSAVKTTVIVSVGVVCFVASKWLAHFVHKVFHYHDYNHAFR